MLIQYCVGWTLAFVFLSIVRGVGTEELGSLQFSFMASMILSGTLGPIIGLISGYAQIITEERIYRRIPIQKLLAIRFTYALIFQILLILIAYMSYQLYFGTDIGIILFATDHGSFAIYFYVLVVDLFFAVLRQVNLMLGEKNLGKLITGKFYTPRVEERIFMFLDLQSSTKWAEQLGHIKYSMLIQDCFNDLGVVVEYEAEIYQYVGDEVILTWPLESGLRHQNCIRAFFAFKKQLTSRETYYKGKYGIVPFFKAGLNAGPITVTEVGRYKKEIAYHGDTINTAARIQGKCNELGEELLISGFLRQVLDWSEFFIKEMGMLPLKGKSETVDIFSVYKNETVDE